MRRDRRRGNRPSAPGGDALVGSRFLGGLGAGNAIALIEPRAEVDQSTGERAEGPVRIAAPGHDDATTTAMGTSLARFHGATLATAVCTVNRGPGGSPALTSLGAFARVGSVAAALPS